MPPVPAGMNFALLFQLFAVLRVQLSLPFIGLTTIAQRGNPVTERLPVDPGSRGPQPRRQIVRSLPF